nr:hypothetical protein [Tanacetum cinerariifolium]
MSTLFADTHNVVAILEKSDAAEDDVIHEILQLDDAEGVNQVGDLSTHTTRFISPVLTQKVFANMRWVGKGFSGVETPLFEDTCFALTRRVKNLEHDKAAQKLEIIKLKARVKRLERVNKVKSSKLRRFRKVGASKRIESSDDMEDVFNQGRMIDDLDKDEGIETKIVISEDVIHEVLQLDDVEGVEIVTEDVANEAIPSTPTPLIIPSPPSHDIPSTSQVQSSHPQQPQSSPQAPLQGVEFPTHLFQQVLDTCSALTHRVKSSKHDKAAQKLEIIKLKERVKRLERANKERMIADLDKDEGIELVVDQVKDADTHEIERRHAAEQAKKQAEINHLDLDHPSKVLSMQEDDSEIQEVVKVVTTAKLITEPMKKKDQIELDAEFARKLHEEINKDHEEINKDID